MRSPWRDGTFEDGACVTGVQRVMFKCTTNRWKVFDLVSIGNSMQNVLIWLLPVN